MIYYISHTYTIICRYYISRTYTHPLHYTSARACCLQGPCSMVLYIHLLSTKASLPIIRLLWSSQGRLIGEIVFSVSRPGRGHSQVCIHLPKQMSIARLASRLQSYAYAISKLHSCKNTSHDEEQVGPRNLSCTHRAVHLACIQDDYISNLRNLQDTSLMTSRSAAESASCTYRGLYCNHKRPSQDCCDLARWPRSVR